MDKVWIFKKTCTECNEDFEIKLAMNSSKARDFNQLAAVCRECTKKIKAQETETKEVTA